LASDVDDKEQRIQFQILFVPVVAEHAERESHRENSDGDEHAVSGINVARLQCFVSL
jgi:hypothetical protein